VFRSTHSPSISILSSTIPPFIFSRLYFAIPPSSIFPSHPPSIHPRHNTPPFNPTYSHTSSIYPARTPNSDLGICLRGDEFRHRVFSMQVGDRRADADAEAGDFVRGSWLPVDLLDVSKRRSTCNQSRA